MIKLQGVLLKAMAQKIGWADAGEIIGVTDRRKGRPSPKRALQGAGLVTRCKRRGVQAAATATTASTSSYRTSAGATWW
jgi:hypothetical protein